LTYDSHAKWLCTIHAKLKRVQKAPPAISRLTMTAFVVSLIKVFDSLLVRRMNLATLTLELMYYPRNAYSDYLPGVSFTIREGGTIVRYGTILSLADAMDRSL
jgi:hypothetical protein